jgi:hypothetical protein
MSDQSGHYPHWPHQPPYGQSPYDPPPPQWSAGQYQQPSFYNDQTQSNLGQLPPPPPYPPANTPQKKQRGLRNWYRTRTRNMKLGLGCGIIIAALLFCSCIGSALGINKTASPPVTPTATADQAAVIVSPAVTPTRAATLNPSPTPTPTRAPTPTPKPQPTQPSIHPTPTRPACQAINNNPWCYNFVPGKLIYYPPTGFCNYFACIPSFNEPDDPGDGYIIECNDGKYSQSGGERGACSYHNGVMRPLYSH